jgi:FeS assembly SUF system protein
MTNERKEQDQVVRGLEERRKEIVAALKTVYDPEIPVDIYELGLIYRLDVSDTGSVFIQMTLTSPACPVAGSLPGDVEAAVGAVEGVSEVSVELVWDPPWDMEKMSEGAKLELGFL